MPKIVPVNVRTLAEFTCLKGDLVPAAQQIDRMNDGSRGHRMLQAALGPGWRSEEYISRDESVAGAVLRVQGRADAVSREDGVLRVMEIKTTVGEPSLIGPGDYPAHMAQAEIYAYLICAAEGRDGAEVILCYYRLDGAEQRWRSRLTFAELRERFLRYAVPYAAWALALEEWKQTSAGSLRDLRFPYDTFRDGQREMAEQVFCALRDGANALIEAPTGIGKTAASLFGALRALGQGQVTALFYLTARTTGRRAAEQALDRMRAKGLRIRSVVITAKEKCCPMEHKECFGCALAADYYERRRDALRDALRIETFSAEAVASLSREYELCPYELSLDLSELADVIICDYNYAFDPRVYLRRWFDQRSKAGLLVDEVHNLPDRARDMYTAELSGARVREVRRLAARYEGKDSPVCEALTDLLRVLSGELSGPEALEEVPERFREAARLFADRAQQIGSPEPEVTELMLDAAWFDRSARRFDEKTCRFLLLPDGKTVTARIWCCDPSERLRRTLERVGGAALFSATLSPMDHYASQLGLDVRGADTLLSLGSPFPPENQLTLRLPVSVRFSDRERTLEAVAQVIHAMAAAHPGNYLACFPSFAYLDMAFVRYRFLFPEETVMRQTNRMGERQRSEFIEAFRARPKRSMVAFIVLGGVFAEGVDLPEDRLSGAAIISTGIPQLSFERELLRETGDDGFGSGYDTAYTYPGLRRVLQAAGRVIRTERDRGVVLLLDTRYDGGQLRSLLPRHWRTVRVRRMDELKQKLKDFWEPEDETFT